MHGHQRLIMHHLQGPCKELVQVHRSWRVLLCLEAYSRGMAHGTPLQLHRAEPAPVDFNYFPCATELVQ
jgi:hypothetical protein